VLSAMAHLATLPCRRKLLALAAAGVVSGTEASGKNANDVPQRFRGILRRGTI
jgi:hypothetical protein